MFNLKNKIALVTGSSRGIGSVISERLSTAGAHVVCVSRSEVEIKKLSKKIKKNGGSSSFFPCDISDKPAVENLIKLTLDRFGQVDILVNNAGITKDNLLIRMSEEQWDMFTTNLNSAFYTTKTVIKSMMKMVGRIVNIS